MTGDFDLLWILSAMFCGWVGARMGEHNRFNPVAGAALGVTVFAVLGADLRGFDSRLAVAAYEGQLLTVAFGLLVGSCFLMLAGRDKALGLIKTGIVVMVVAVLLSLIPRGAEYGPVEFSMNDAVPEGVGIESILESELPTRVLIGLKNSGLGFKTLGRVRQPADSFFSLSPPRGAGTLRPGEWLLVRKSVSHRGEQWSEVLVADENGQYREENGRVVLVPATALTFHAPARVD